ncbi:MAG: amylo-alpha-1,6-glucosidase, partial [Bacteroidales bacterium]|nr:amylo-alpha-1,6-glucosidase [Bacteroidales bacterium]
MFKSDKNELSNLEVSLRKEFICVSDNGTYASSTLSGCNSRKYHGLYVCPQPDLNQDNFVLLSSLEETVCQQDKEFHIGVKRYAGHVFSPKGHKYIEAFEYLTHPVWFYRVGGVLLRKELLMHSGQNRLLIKYTLEEAHSETSLVIRPFLAFRDVHELTMCNDTACTQLQYTEKGIKCRLYPSFSALYMQTSRSCRVTDNPDWYRQVEYAAEKERGYHCREDLFTPGTLSVPLTLHEPLVLSVGLTPLAAPENAVALFEEARASLIPMDNMENCLRAAADSFIVHKEGRCQIVAGYPWFGSWGRDTFISLPGLTLCTGKNRIAAEILRSMLKDQSGGLFPNVGYGEQASYNSADAPLWFVWA